MKTNNKRKADGKKSAKKSYFNSVQFLIAAFCCLFVFLGVITFTAMSSTDATTANTLGIKNSEPETKSDYTSFFDFKNGSGQTLTLTLGSYTTTDLLIIENYNAIKSVLVTTADGAPISDNACISVSQNPFKIETHSLGEARVYVTAKMKNRTLCQKWINIVVKSKAFLGDDPSDQPTKPAESDFELVCNIVSSLGNTKELDFYLLDKRDKKVSAITSLEVQVLHGTAVVDINGHTATLSFASLADPCVVLFTTQTGGVNAEFLFVNSAS